MSQPSPTDTLSTGDTRPQTAAPSAGTRLLSADPSSTDAPSPADASASTDAQTLRARREALVLEHMESENVHDFDTTMATFAHPRYELIATDEVYDGEAEVRRYFEESRTAFPDQRNELIALHHTDDAVIVEFDLLGTHLGPLRALPPTGRAFRTRMTSFFIFEGERLVCERAYFDQSSILRQLGLARDPSSLLGRVTLLLSHPLTIGRAVLDSRRARSRTT
jgi:steroid delta-isomerase-like uncharacterized protein